MSGALSGLVGNDTLKKRLGAEIRSGSLAHAYIIEGRKGCGKHTVARIIAAAISCEHRDSAPDTVPCRTCESCRKILGDLSQDVITVRREDGKATLGVEVIRALREGVAIVPGELDRKIYVIEDGDLMTEQAQNALLLTLEEPPPFVLFLLLCENARSLLDTIRSRAPTLRVEPLSHAEVDSYLTENEPRARVVKNTAEEEYRAILTASDGSIGEALRLLDPKARKHFLDERARVEAFVDACAERKPAGALIPLLSAFPQKRIELVSSLSLVMTALRDLIALSRADDPHLCFYTDRETAAEKAASFSLSTLASIFEATDRAIDALLCNANVSLTVVNLAVEVGA